MGLYVATESIFNQLEDLLEQIEEEDYAKPLDILSGSSIGQHMRHILEFYLCVLSSQVDEDINYDNRKRDKALETSLVATLNVLNSIKDRLSSIKTDYDVNVSGQLGGVNNTIRSSIRREILYAIEHAVHHMAIMKIGVKTSLSYILLPKGFGIAESTIRYRNQCAQ